MHTYILVDFFSYADTYISLSSSHILCNLIFWYPELGTKQVFREQSDLRLWPIGSQVWDGREAVHVNLKNLNEVQAKEVGGVFTANTWGEVYIVPDH